MGSSTAMELEGTKGCFDNLQKVAGLAIKVFVSDRHRGIAKWIRENQPSVDHYFDQWHVAKGLVKKLHFPECAHDDNTEPRKWIKVGH